MQLLIDKQNEALNLVTIVLDDNTRCTYTALDVAYTISIKYRDILVNPNVYINSQFPTSCLTFELTTKDKSVEAAMLKSDADLYFDADGIFVFRNEIDPNPNRAAIEFYALYREGKHIQAPSIATFTAETDYVHVHKGFGKETKFYLYTEY